MPSRGSISDSWYLYYAAASTAESVSQRSCVCTSLFLCSPFSDVYSIIRAYTLSDSPGGYIGTNAVSVYFGPSVRWPIAHLFTLESTSVNVNMTEMHTWLTIAYTDSLVISSEHIGFIFLVSFLHFFGYVLVSYSILRLLSSAAE